MQLHFTIDQLKLLVEVLQDNGDPHAEGLLDMVLARDMRFGSDELEDLGDMVSSYLQSDPDHASAKRAALQQILDKITEACAMA